MSSTASIAPVAQSFSIAAIVSFEPLGVDSSSFSRSLKSKVSVLSVPSSRSSVSSVSTLSAPVLSSDSDVLTTPSGSSGAVDSDSACSDAPTPV